jgi:hypothetical protein
MLREPESRPSGSEPGHARRVVHHRAMEDTETGIPRGFRQARSDDKESEASSCPASGPSVRSVVSLSFRIKR